MSKNNIDANKEMDQMRSLLSSDIFTIIDYLDKNICLKSLIGGCFVFT